MRSGRSLLFLLLLLLIVKCLSTDNNDFNSLDDGDDHPVDEHGRRLQLCPVLNPVCRPTPRPTPQPVLGTMPPTKSPTKKPTLNPTKSPTHKPTLNPTKSPTHKPTFNPTKSPTHRPTLAPTLAPSFSPTLFPTLGPTFTPTLSPTYSPSKSPTHSPSDSPSKSPTKSPTFFPTISPTLSPTHSPTVAPSKSPTHSPTHSPSKSPTKSPTFFPSLSPTNEPTDAPTPRPTLTPTFSPTKFPTHSPVNFPTLHTNQPTENPTAAPTTSAPTEFPTKSPTHNPTNSPTKSPTRFPTKSPTRKPTFNPTRKPTFSPSESPTVTTGSPVFVLPLETSLSLECQIYNKCAVSSQSCLIDSECYTACGDEFGTCATSDRARRAFISLCFLVAYATFFSISCVGCAWSRQRTLRKQQTNRGNSAPKTVNNTSEPGLQFNLAQKCSELVSENIRMKETFKMQFKNVNSIRVQNELDKAIWMHSIVALAAMFHMFVESSGNEKVSSRNLNHFLSDLHQVSQRLWFALNMSHTKQSRESECEKGKQEMVLAAKLLPTVITGKKAVSATISPQIILAKFSPKDNSWGWHSENHAKLTKICESLKPTFVKLEDDGLEHKLTREATGFFGWMRGSYMRFKRHWPIYTLFFVSLAAIFISKAAWINGDVTKLSQRTFLGTPAYYTMFNSHMDIIEDPVRNGSDIVTTSSSRRMLADSVIDIRNSNLISVNSQSLQSIFVPLIYAFMHCAIFCLALLPLPMCRGLWREISIRFSGIQKILPVNDFEVIHIQLGFITLMFLLVGAIIFAVVITLDCYHGVQNACVAFDPILVFFSNDSNTAVRKGNWGSPIDNVIVLRFIVLILWFPLLPLLYWAKKGNDIWLVRNIAVLRRNWFEICFYTHVIVALASIVLALVCRFKVFYVLLPTWSLYILDRFFDRVFYAVNMTLTERTVFSRDSLKTIPNSMRLKFAPIKKNLPIAAGQWIYLQVPKIDHTWHPFSLASASSDKELELHVGVISYPGDWQDVVSGDASQTALKNKNPTWTARLFGLVNTPNPYVNAKVMGPYGWAFSSCFNANKYAGSVVIGAGTGLTAAESVLREYIFLKKQEMHALVHDVSKSSKPTDPPTAVPVGDDNPKFASRLHEHKSDSSAGAASRHRMVPQKVWFIWSCREVDDLLWCWNNLVRLIVELCEQRIVDINTLVVPESSMLDWLGVTIYVTRAKADVMQEFRASFNLGMKSETSNTPARSRVNSAKSQSSPSKLFRNRLGLGRRKSSVEETNNANDNNNPTNENTNAHPETLVEPNPAVTLKSQPSDAITYDEDYEITGGGISNDKMSHSQIEDKVKAWLYSRVIEGGLGDKETHIARYLNGCRKILDDTEQREKGLSVCFCGPSALSVTIQEAVEICPGNTKIEFSADHM